MESIENLIFGDPVYDCKGRVVRRNFGIKNIVIILAIVYGLYSLRGKMAIKSGVKSGRGKLRGGGAREGGSDTDSQESKTTNTSSNGSGRKGTSVWREVVLPFAAIWSFIIIIVVFVMIGNAKHEFG